MAQHRSGAARAFWVAIKERRMAAGVRAVLAKIAGRSQGQTPPGQREPSCHSRRWRSTRTWTADMASFIIQRHSQGQTDPGRGRACTRRVNVEQRSLAEGQVLLPGRWWRRRPARLPARLCTSACASGHRELGVCPTAVAPLLACSTRLVCSSEGLSAEQRASAHPPPNVQTGQWDTL